MKSRRNASGLLFAAVTPAKAAIRRHSRFATARGENWIWVAGGMTQQLPCRIQEGLELGACWVATSVIAFAGWNWHGRPAVLRATLLFSTNVTAGGGASNFSGIATSLS